MTIKGEVQAREHDRVAAVALKPGSDHLLLFHCRRRSLVLKSMYDTGGLDCGGKGRKRRAAAVEEGVVDETVNGGVIDDESGWTSWLRTAAQSKLSGDTRMVDGGGTHEWLQMHVWLELPVGGGRGRCGCRCRWG